MKRMTYTIVASLALLCYPGIFFGQQADKDLSIGSFDPNPTLKVPKTDLQRAKFPVIDVHTHCQFKLRGNHQRLLDYVETMKTQNIAISISLDATLGREEEHLKYISHDGPQRVVAFVHIDFRGSGQPNKPETWAANQPGFVHNCVEQLRVAKTNGIVGLKFFKQFGLGYKNADGSLTKIDDPRFDPIWKTCGELGLPVIIHTADPVAFFQANDKTNERAEELLRHPDWSFYGDQFPDRDDLLAARNRVIKRHPGTTFIGAHCANNAEDLATVGKWLDEHPNLVIEFASRINELGRQPYTARKFVLKYQDRIMFGTDGPWSKVRLGYYWRFLESWDEYFPYSEKSPPPQGFWRIYGIGLPDDVLKKVYHENALRVMPNLKATFDAVVSPR